MRCVSEAMLAECDTQSAVESFSRSMEVFVLNETRNRRLCAVGGGGGCSGAEINCSGGMQIGELSSCAASVRADVMLGPVRFCLIC